MAFGGAVHRFTPGRLFFLGAYGPCDMNVDTPALALSPETLCVHGNDRVEPFVLLE